MGSARGHDLVRVGLDALDAHGVLLGLGQLVERGLVDLQQVLVLGVRGHEADQRHLVGAARFPVLAGGQA
ncbi:hypothetical protein AB4156_30175 [Cupriavidus sp. 2MCAB6]|uniref:hypothetical protein n=1 Tax=Cupriavidus sp. 2MCAB6 TaxID=3232981 RepID=UPI003F92078F